MEFKYKCNTYNAKKEKNINWMQIMASKDRLAFFTFLRVVHPSAKLIFGLCNFQINSRRLRNPQNRFEKFDSTREICNYHCRPKWFQQECHFMNRNDSILTKWRFLQQQMLQLKRRPYTYILLVEGVWLRY